MSTFVEGPRLEPRFRESSHDVQHSVSLYCIAPPPNVFSKLASTLDYGRLGDERSNPAWTSCSAVNNTKAITCHPMVLPRLCPNHTHSLNQTPTLVQEPRPKSLQTDTSLGPSLPSVTHPQLTTRRRRSIAKCCAWIWSCSHWRVQDSDNQVK
ncbi:hypothetical protein BJ165DRAFT_771490 [Panaeolus papilionaceus]|nr:hypothetical protein BJ165DRAFT_771490 [Panaeolus papilionaceus]